MPTAYRLANPSTAPRHFTADTLDRLCATLNVQPGELIEWVSGEELGNLAAPGAEAPRGGDARPAARARRRASSRARGRG